MATEVKSPAILEKKVKEVAQKVEQTHKRIGNKGEK